MASPNVVSDLGKTIVQRLQIALDRMVPKDNVLIATPDSFKALPKPACTIFLYRVAENSLMRNGPRVNVSPGVTSRPMLPLDLSYLITPWGVKPEDEHLILGASLQALYDFAELGRGDLVGDSWLPNDSVQLVLETLTLAEHFCIWDTVQMPYRLSLTYMARIVGIAAKLTETSPPVVQAMFGVGSR